MQVGTVSPADMLEGQSLADGWRVVRRLDRPAGATGGTFSVGYLVEHPDGRKGFCKALDYTSMLAQADPAVALQVATAGYLFERNLYRKCGERRMSRVVKWLGDGVITPPGQMIPVNYIILERAEYDIRQELDLEADLEATLRLRTLHHVATGLRQLHQHLIVHQDLKPSNVLVFTSAAEGRNSKITDLGRATDVTIPAFQDDLKIAGDASYAPPEQLYNAIPQDFGPRRLACDLYQLGSLATFMFTTASMNALLKMELAPAHAWTSWTGTYEEVLPYVRAAYGKALETFRSETPKSVSQELTKLVGYLCDPDPFQRGYPLNKENAAHRYDLERFISKLDMLSIRASMRARGIIS